jgi:hypothetical protein
MNPETKQALINFVGRRIEAYNEFLEDDTTDQVADLIDTIVADLEYIQIKLAGDA